MKAQSQSSSIPIRRSKRFLGVIEREAYDERNFVRKAVNWALRNIGKKNLRLDPAAISVAERIRIQILGRIAAGALRELRSDAVQSRLHRKASQNSWQVPTKKRD